MASIVEICNKALGDIRAGSINSLDEKSVQAQQCKLRYEGIVNRCLADGGWGFNTVIDSLVLLDVEIFTYLYAYKYPNNCLKILRLISPAEEISGDYDMVSRLLDSRILPIQRRQIPYKQFNVDGVKAIGTNLSEARAEFVIKVTDPNLFTPDFEQAVQYLLASELAIPVIGGEAGQSLRDQSLQLYVNYLNSAAANDMNDQFSEPAESEYILARR